jgi:general secretion pathway protein G
MATRLLSRRVGGFSFVELLASMVILGLLASVAMPLAQTSVRREKEFQLRRALRDLRQGIDAYKAATADGRIVVAPDASGYPPDLDTLVSGVENAKDKNAGPLYFLRRIPRDPLYPEKTVPASATWGQRAYASPPQAPRKGDDVFDVYSLSEGTALDGSPYREW